MDGFVAAESDTEDGHEDYVDEELRRDLHSLRAVLEAHEGPTDGEPGPSWLCGEPGDVHEEGGDVGRPDTVAELHGLLQKNWQLQFVLREQLLKVEQLLVLNDVKQLKSLRGGRRVAFNLRRFTKDSYFRDHTGAFPPGAAAAADRAEDFYSKEALWGSNREKKLNDGVRQQAIENRTRPLQYKLGMTESRKEKSTIKQQFQAIQKLPDEDLLANPGNINWDMIAFEMFSNTKSAKDCQLHWDNVMSPTINVGPWSSDEDKKLMKLAPQHNCTDWPAIAKELNTNRSAFACLQRYQRSLNPKMLKKEWAKEDDEALREACKKYGSRNWKAVSVYVGNNRTAQQCLHRWYYTLKPGIKKGRWSPAEDELLCQAVKSFGVGNWTGLCAAVPGRTAMQCRERWVNVLDDRLKHGPWSDEEDEKLMHLCQKHKNSNGSIKWSKVATEMGNRTDNMCSKRWKFLTPVEEVMAQYKSRAKYRDILGSNFQGRRRERPSLSAQDLEEDMLSQEAKEKIRKYENRVQATKRNLAWHTGRRVSLVSVTESAEPTPDKELIPENEYEFYGSILKARTAARRRRQARLGKGKRKKRAAKDTTEQATDRQSSCPTTKTQSSSAPMSAASSSTVASSQISQPVVSSRSLGDQAYPTMYEQSAVFLQQYESRLGMTGQQGTRATLPSTGASVIPPPTSALTPVVGQDYLPTESIPSPNVLTDFVHMLLPEKPVSSYVEGASACELAAEAADMRMSSTNVSTTATTVTSVPVFSSQHSAAQAFRRTNPESAISVAVQALLDLNEVHLESSLSPFHVCDSVPISGSPPRYTSSPLSTCSDSSSTGVVESYCRPFSYADPLFPGEGLPRWGRMAHPLHEATCVPVYSLPGDASQYLPLGGVHSCAGPAQQAPHSATLLLSVTGDGPMHSQANVTSSTVHSTPSAPDMSKSVLPATVAVPASTTPVNQASLTTGLQPASTCKTSFHLQTTFPQRTLDSVVLSAPASSVVAAPAVPALATTPVAPESVTTSVQPMSTCKNLFPQRTLNSVVFPTAVPLPPVPAPANSSPRISPSVSSLQLLTTFPARLDNWTPLVSSSTTVVPTGTSSLPANLAISSPSATTSLSTISTAMFLPPLTVPPFILRSSGREHHDSPSVSAPLVPTSPLQSQISLNPLRSDSVPHTSPPTSSLNVSGVSADLLNFCGKKDVKESEGPLIANECEFFRQEDELMIVKLENPMLFSPELASVQHCDRQVQSHLTVTSEQGASVGVQPTEHVHTSVVTQTAGPGNAQPSKDTCMSGSQEKGGNTVESLSGKRSRSEGHDEPCSSKRKRRNSQAGARPRGGDKAGVPEARSQTTPQGDGPRFGQPSRSPLVQQTDMSRRGKGRKRNKTRAALSASPPAAGL